MSEPLTIFGSRAESSRIRLDELQGRLAGAPQVKPLADFTIFTAGSYGRQEASSYSDIDLFFLYEGKRDKQAEPRTAELRLFGALIEMVDLMQFPVFSNDAQYLNTLSSSEILEFMGSPKDDHENLFTVRMLMLLESKCLYGFEAYNCILKSIIKSYYRDFHDHEATFQPVFLLNDIGRFWKTLLLNYEHKRNQPTDGADEDKEQLALNKTKQKTRNFKLKFSRMTTCFATIAALGSSPAPVTEEGVFELIQLTPRERLERVAELRPDTEPAVLAVLKDYAWFLEQTALSEDDLYKLFNDKGQRTTMFGRANEYGETMFELLATIDRNAGGAPTRFLRYLVI